MYDISRALLCETVISARSSGVFLTWSVFHFPLCEIRDWTGDGRKSICRGPVSRKSGPRAAARVQLKWIGRWLKNKCVSPNKLGSPVSRCRPWNLWNRIRPFTRFRTLHTYTFIIYIYDIRPEVGRQNMIANTEIRPHLYTSPVERFHLLLKTRVFALCLRNLTFAHWRVLPKKYF